MYYILFTHVYTNRKEEKAWERLRSEAEVIEFLHKNYQLMSVHEIIEVKAKLRLGLIITGDYVKSTLGPEEEPESLVQLGRKPEEILKENKKKLEKLENGEPSAMSKIAGDIEKEQEENGVTDEEKVEKQIDEADQLIEREKEREKQRKKGWKLCTVCNSNRVAPWNKKKICSTCQTKRSTNRPYSKREEAPGL